MGFCVSAVVFLLFMMNGDADIRLAAPFISVFIAAITAFLMGVHASYSQGTGATLTFRLIFSAARQSANH